MWRKVLLTGAGLAALDEVGGVVFWQVALRNSMEARATSGAPLLLKDARIEISAIAGK